MLCGGGQWVQGCGRNLTLKPKTPPGGFLKGRAGMPCNPCTHHVRVASFSCIFLCTSCFRTLTAKHKRAAPQLLLPPNDPWTWCTHLSAMPEATRGVKCNHICMLQMLEASPPPCHD